MYEICDMIYDNKRVIKKKNSCYKYKNYWMELYYDICRNVYIENCEFV